MICTDRQRLQQIIINLLSNALKYTFKGSITVEFVMENENDNFIKISVSDTGAGMPSHVIKNLFQEYGTFDHFNHSNKQGVGLGLNICRKLCIALGPYD